MIDDQTAQSNSDGWRRHAAGGGPGILGFNTVIQSGQSISIFNQAIATNGKVKNLARIINAPFALGYVTANPAAYSYPVMNLSL
jgi:hypothetical protein